MLPVRFKCGGPEIEVDLVKGIQYKGTVGRRKPGEEQQLDLNAEH